MKAIYQKPATDILLVNMQALMGASLGNGEKPNSFNVNDPESTDGLPDGWSPNSRRRRRNEWDDDDEFDEGF